MWSQRSTLADSESAWSQLVAEQRRLLPQLWDLTVSNPTQVALDAPWERVAEILSRHQTLCYTPEPLGWLPAREAISAYHRHAVPPERIVLAASTSELYGWLFQLLCDDGDEVVIPTPSYPLFDCLAQLQGVRTRPVAWVWSAGTWWLDRDALLAALTPRTKAILLVSPNNPTGAVLLASDLQFVSALCAERNLALVVDEVFADYVPHWPADSVRSCAGHDGCLTFVLSGLSKVALLPQLKLGWLAVSGPEPWVRVALQRLEWIADTYLSVASPIQHAAAELLEVAPVLQQALRQRIAAHRQQLAGVVRHTAASLLVSDGGWLAIVRLPEPDEHELERSVRLLQQTGVLVQPGWLYDLPFGDSFVVSLLAEPSVFGEGVGRLGRWMDSRGW